MRQPVIDKALSKRHDGTDGLGRFSVPHPRLQRQIITGRHYAASAKTYLPLATRTNSGNGPTEWEASTQLTEFAETVSPSAASTAAWTCATRIGPAWSAITSRTASRTQPGRRGRSRRLAMARGWASLARRSANFLARWLNPDRVSCAASAARSSDTILSIAPESWFQYPPLIRIRGNCPQMRCFDRWVRRARYDPEMDVKLSFGKCVPQYVHLRPVCCRRTYLR
jgi:hypothetical protein